MRAVVLLLPVAALLGGCVSTAAAVVKAPFKVVGAGVDAVTTSQEEADRNRGREIRKQEEREAKERRRAEKRAQEAARDED